MILMGTLKLINIGLPVLTIEGHNLELVDYIPIQATDIDIDPVRVRPRMIKPVDATDAAAG